MCVLTASKRDCIELFGQRTIERINSDNDVICTTEYSRIVPLENGEVVVSLVNGRPGAMNFSYSPVLRDFTKATNIRLRFLRTNTLLGHLMGKALRDPTVTRRVGTDGYWVRVLMGTGLGYWVRIHGSGLEYWVRIHGSGYWMVVGSGLGYWVRIHGSGLGYWVRIHGSG
ncbi:unnamed protein product [Oncorhynchus mykiss]|uniref:Laminin N-terminal domain-containing protein n=1 Tax=Oncorhynchus mykiss TaxID=8022 RepID=A0A060ZAF9_ONCMY|nr:unnamed protein product [Oncorhynchus mykiss]